MAMCYEKMNLNGAEIDFKRCRDSLLKHAEAVKHDWPPSQPAADRAENDEAENDEADDEEADDEEGDEGGRECYGSDSGFERLGSAANDLLTGNGDDLH
eukprot:s12288_g1.t1